MKPTATEECNVCKIYRNRNTNRNELPNTGTSQVRAKAWCSPSRAVYDRCAGDVTEQELLTSRKHNPDAAGRHIDGGYAQLG